MILQTNDHVTFIKSIIRNASEEGRCVNEIESEEIANSLKAMLQECDDLDGLGRCSVAFANLHQSIMPTEDRESIGMVKPSGWKTDVEM